MNSGVYCLTGAITRTDIADGQYLNITYVFMSHYDFPTRIELSCLKIASYGINGPHDFARFVLPERAREQNILCLVFLLIALIAFLLPWQSLPKTAALAAPYHPNPSGLINLAR